MKKIFSTRGDRQKKRIHFITTVGLVLQFSILIFSIACKEKNPFTPPGPRTDILSSMDQEEIAKLGDAVKVSGKVIYDNYKKGMIQIDVVPVKGKGAGPITIKRLEKPGDFALYVPKETGKVNIVCFVDENANGPDGQDPKGSYEKNPIDIGVDEISGIELKIVDTVPPPLTQEGEEKKVSPTGEQPASLPPAKGKGKEVSQKGETVKEVPPQPDNARPAKQPADAEPKIEPLNKGKK